MPTMEPCGTPSPSGILRCEREWGHAGAHQNTDQGVNTEWFVGEEPEEGWWVQ